VAKIRAEDVAEVRQTARIEEVVGQSVTLKPAGGGSLKGLCPFHDERTPSFQVSPGKGLWYCFGCGEGGDTIDFVMRTDALTFAEAVEKLADTYGVTLRYEEGSVAPGRQQGQRTRLIAANKEAQQFFTAQLATSEAQIGRQFLIERGFDEHACEQFGVGYAPKSWGALVDHLRARGFRDDELRAAGLVSEGQRGVYDRFRGRLTWPIHDVAGEVVGFGARKLYDDDNGPKYLNTPETALYKKSNVLYGVDKARPAIVKSQKAVIVEGYTDVMACHLAGVTTAVATCGTSFGEGHVKILRRLLMDNDAMRGKVVFTFDGDAAGRRAALRAFEMDQSFVAQTYVAVESDGLDPCDLRLRDGDDAVRQLVARAKPMFEFAIASTLDDFDLASAEGRVAAMRACAPMVHSIRDVALRDEYINRLAGWVGLEHGTVRQAVQRADRLRAQDQTTFRDQVTTKPTSEHRVQPSPSAVADAGDQRLERQAIQVMVQRPDLVWEWIVTTEEAAFTDPAAAAVFRVIAASSEPVGVSEADLRSWLDEVIASAPDDAVRAELRRWSVLGLPVADTHDVAGYAQGVMARLHAWDVTRRIGPLKGALARIDAATEPEKFAETMAALMDLENYRRELLSMSVGESE
jgi:DNA primase